MLTKANREGLNYMFDNIFLNLSSTHLANAVYLLHHLQYILDDKVSSIVIPPLSSKDGLVGVRFPGRYNQSK
jgi:hypothetical protein